MLSRSIACVAIVVIAQGLVFARMKVQVEYDKQFNFKPMRTWAWNPKGRGDVKMARTKDDNAEEARQRAEPIIVDAVNTEIVKRGLTEVTFSADLFVTYYLLLTNTMSAQTMGQFVPLWPVEDWHVPIGPPATQSLKMMNSGSLVLDLSTKEQVVWRGVARAQLDIVVDEKKREAALREAVRDLLKKYPPR